MKVKKLVKHLGCNTHLIFYKNKAEKPFAECDSIYLERNPLLHDNYFLLNYKIKYLKPDYLKGIAVNCLRITVEDE